MFCPTQASNDRASRGWHPHRVWAWDPAPPRSGCRREVALERHWKLGQGRHAVPALRLAGKSYQPSWEELSGQSMNTRGGCSRSGSEDRRDERRTPGAETAEVFQCARARSCQKRCARLAPPVARPERRGDRAHVCRLRSRCPVLDPQHATTARSRIGPRDLVSGASQGRRAPSIHVREAFVASLAATKARHGANLYRAPR